MIVPLTVGLLGLGLYIWVEKNFVQRPTIPFEILRVTWLGYLTTFVHGMTVLSVVYFLPTFYQACRGASPVRGGLDLLSLSFTLTPFGMVVGMIITREWVYCHFLGVIAELLLFFGSARDDQVQMAQCRRLGFAELRTRPYGTDPRGFTDGLLDWIVSFTSLSSVQGFPSDFRLLAVRFCSGAAPVSCSTPSFFFSL